MTDICDILLKLDKDFLIPCLKAEVINIKYKTGDLTESR